MYKPNIKHLVTLFLLFCMVFTSILPVAAKSAPPPSTDDTQVKTYLQETQAYENAIREMEQYIYVTKAGTLALSDAFPISLSRSNAIYADLLASLDKTNQMLQTKEVSLGEIDLTTFDDSGKDEATPEGCNGSNKTKKYWWGRKFHFDSCKVNAIAGGLLAGAALTLWNPPVAAVLAVEFAVFFSLAQLGGNQKGMFLAMTWVGIHWWGIQ